MNLYSQWCKKHVNSKQLALQQLSPFHWLCVFAWLYSILLLLLQDQMLPMLPLAGIQPLQRAWPPEFSERLHFVACQMCTWSCWAGFKCMTCCHSASSSWLPHSPNWQRRLKHVSMTKQKGDIGVFHDYLKDIDEPLDSYILFDAQPQRFQRVSEILWVYMSKCSERVSNDGCSVDHAAVCRRLVDSTSPYFKKWQRAHVSGWNHEIDATTKSQQWKQ